jgi:hypothetical protein
VLTSKYCILFFVGKPLLLIIVDLPIITQITQ